MMQSSEKLTRLMDRAACCVNMLSPTDLSDAGDLQAVFTQIEQAISELGGGGELLSQVKDTTSVATETLQSILQEEVDDSARSIEAVCQAVGVLQDLIEQISGGQSICDPIEEGEEPVDSPEPESETEESPSKSGTVAEEGMIVPEEDVALVLDFIAEAYEHIEGSESGLLELESKPDDNEVLNLIFRAFHTIKGMAGFLNLTEIGSLAHSAENLLDLARKGELILVGANMDVIFESIDMLKKMIGGLKDSVEAGTSVPAQKNLPDMLVKLKAAAEGQNLEASLNTPEGLEKDKELDKVLAEDSVPKQAEVATKTRAVSSDDKIKVSTTRLDNLINMAGELVIAQSMIAEEVESNMAGERVLGRKITHQSKIVRELQELSMSMRMVPIQGVFQKMARLVRDLSRKSGRQVSFSTVGEDTELDRSIVDKIADPLVHMVRNSVDHGIEPPDERRKAGKNVSGLIELRAFHQAGNIVIEIEDDGRGLNKERILKKAIENGIVEPDQDLSDEQIFKLIFHAGLSTAEKITSVSGRGVGMDVVKKNIDLLQGKIDISSAVGKGTTITVRMPLTLAIIDGQIVTVGESRYVIPINSIVRSLKPTPKQLSSVQSRGEMVMVHGQLLPLVRLYKLFDITPTTEEPAESLVVVVEEDNNRYCLLVDELLGQQQVVIKSLGSSLGVLKGVSGGAIMGDGRISLILDIPGLIELACK